MRYIQLMHIIIVHQSLQVIACGNRVTIYSYYDIVVLLSADNVLRKNHLLSTSHKVVIASKAITTMSYF